MADQNDIAARWYNAAPSDAPYIDDADWLYVPHPDPRYGGHWTKLSPERAAELRKRARGSNG